MDLVRVGLGIRALRMRRDWRQVDLALASGISQTLISLIERGHGDRISIQTLLGVAAALDSRLVLQIRWRAGDLDRLVDADHALVGATMVRRLGDAGWETRVEVTYASRGISGSIDVLGWHPATRSLLVIEIKTQVASAEATLRKLDEKGRIAAAVAQDRFGWRAATVSRVLAIEDTSTNRRRLLVHAALFASALPLSGADVRRWVRKPERAIAGMLFLSPSNGGAGIQRLAGRHRMRRRSGTRKRPELSVARDEFAVNNDRTTRVPTILVG